jgi:ribokinase
MRTHPPRIAVVGSANVDLIAFSDRFPNPGETKAETISGHPVRSVDDARACAQLLLAQGLTRVIITLGEKGALLVTSQVCELVPGCAVQPRNTTGAGDAFIGSFAVFLAEGFGERDAIGRANLYAALSTTAVGAQKSFVSRRRFDEEWNTRSS